MLGLLTFILVPVQLLLLVFAMRGFSQPSGSGCPSQQNAAT